MHIRKTKIVATIGPASSGEQELFGMIHAGMNAARIDISKGAFEDHSKVIDLIRVYADKMHIAVAVILDRNGEKNVSSEDFEFLVKKNVDFVVLSKVETVEDIRKVRDMFKKHKADIGIIAKIQTKEAVENIDAIIEAVDGLMVGNEDLADQVKDENATLLQKVIVKKAIAAGKPVITATKMLPSMISSPVPTNLEVNEVTNAILDGTDAIMLVDETTSGRHPVLSVETLSRIALFTERSALFAEDVTKFERTSRGIVDAVSEAAAKTVKNIGAEAIITLSEKGFTPRMVARFKPDHSIFVLTPHVRTFRRVILSFACAPELLEQPIKTLNEAVSVSKKLLVRKKQLKEGDKFVVVAGMPFGITEGTNMILVQTI